jgi:hypothetical protein
MSYIDESMNISGWAPRGKNQLKILVKLKLVRS